MTKPVVFSAVIPDPAIPVDGVIYRRGKIFEIGEYPDKEFSLDEAEADEAIAAFQPVEIDLEHVDTVLAGKLGHLTDVKRDGKTVFGTVAIPEWLDKVLADGERKVSCTWDRATKRLTKLALVRNPRVTDAALMAAFAASDEAPADFAFPVPGAAPAAGPPAAAAPPQKNPMQSVHDYCVKNGAVCAAPAAAPAPGGPPAQMSENEKKMARQLDELQFKADLADARTFADTQVRAKKIFPSQRDKLAEAFAQATRDDRATGQVTFSNGTSTTRTDMLKQLIGLSVPHKLTEEMVEDEGPSDADFAADPKGKEMSPERRKELLGMTNLGLAALEKDKT